MSTSSQPFWNRLTGQQICLGIAACFMSFYLIAWLWPEAWWGVHYLAFLSPVVAGSFFLLGVGLWFLGAKSSRFQQLIIRDFQAEWVPYLPVSIACVFGLLFFVFPIVFDRYGDAAYWYLFAEKTVTEYESKWLKLIFSPNIFHSKVGQRTLLNSFSLLSWMSGLDVKMVIRLFDAICGALFIYIWLGIIRRNISGRHSQILLALIGCTSPFLLIYFGHIELYAPVVTAQLAFGAALFAYFRSPQNRQLLFLVLLWLLNVKLHTSAFVLLPGLGLIFLVHFLPNWEWQQVTATKLLRYILFPIFIFGIILYVFVLEDFNDPRWVYPGIDTSERWFLPILGLDPPLDRYYLQSFAHIFDYFQSVLIGPNSGVILLSAIVILYRKKINWQHPLVLLTTLTCLLYGLLFFMINPLVGMPFDWDLFTLPTVSFLLVLVALLSQVKDARLGAFLMGPVMAIALLNSACFVMHQSEEATGERYISMGKYTFKTYWFRAGDDVNYGIELLAKKKSKDEILAYRLASIEGLEPYAVANNDREYAELLSEVGKQYLREIGDVKTSIPYFVRARSYAPNHSPVLIGLLEAYFVDSNFPEALKIADQLIQLKKPSPQRALKMGIHCALMANAYEQAYTYSEASLKLDPSDEVVQEVYQRLQQGDRVEELVLLFSGGEEE